MARVQGRKETQEEDDGFRLSQAFRKKEEKKRKKKEKRKKKKRERLSSVAFA